MVLENKFYDNFNEILTPCNITKTRKANYNEVIIAFDIEVSSFYNNNEKQSIMYAWTMCIEGKSYLGRTWEEFINAINIIKEYYNVNYTNRIIIYVHNLSYEFQFIKDFFEWDFMLCLEERKVICATTMDGIEFKCSYLLSGYSLAKVADNLTKFNIKKLKGDLKYELLRTPITPLTEEEKGYILNDGLIVNAYISEQIDQYGTITAIPYTKTGKVRKICRKNCFASKNKADYNFLMEDLTLTPETYKLAKEAYSGGFTHGSMKKIGQVFHNVASFDFTSAYPSCMLSEKFPMSAPIHKNLKDENEFISYLNRYNCIFQIRFYNLRQKFEYESYISISKCYELEDYFKNNGRITGAKVCALTITEVDFKIITQVYDFDAFEVSNFYYMKRGFLPKPIIETVLELYETKTKLKGVEGKEAEYLNSKENLNSLYGMCCTDIVRPSYNYSDNEWHTIEPNLEDEILKYNNSFSRFLFYYWGIYITAYDRYNLWQGIIEFGEDYLYSDTDSLKVINHEKHLDFINTYNNNIQQKVYRVLSYYKIDVNRAKPKNIKGVEKPIGVWDFEGIYDRFKTLGAKRYIYEVDNEIHITISGVNKEVGVNYLKWKYKTNDAIFDAFTEKLLFPATYDVDNKQATGKQVLTYLDKSMSGVITDYLGNVYKYHEPSGIHMEASSYCLSLDIEYANIIYNLLKRGAPLD